MNAPRPFSALVVSIMSLTVSAASAGEWTTRTFTLKMSSKNAPAQACPEEANLYPLRSLKGFRVDGDKMTIPVPVSGLRAKTQNTVALRCASAGGEHFYPKLYYDYLMPRPKFYYDPTATASGN